MKSRKTLLKKSCLYLILDKEVAARRSLDSLVNQSSNCGISVIQLRDKISPQSLVTKEAAKISRLLKKSKILFLVNDYLEAAKVPFCDGVHLGQADTPLKEARKALGRAKIIGISCHNLKQAIKAERDGADYIGIGPINRTPTKPEYNPIGLGVLRQLNGKIKIPYFAIGNINLGNLKGIFSAGARRAAVCRGILGAKNIRKAALEYSREFCCKR